MSGLRIAAPVLLALSAVACASTGSASWTEPAHHYRVLLLPVEGAEAALAEPVGEDGIPVAVTAEELEAHLREGLEEGRVFSELVSDPSEEEADLVLRVTVKSARIEDLGMNGGAVWSTFAWLMVPTPLWIVDDRSYATDFSVQAELYASDDLERPTASFVASSGDQTLDLWDRGISPLVIVVPPALLKGSDETLGEVLTERGIAQVTEALVAELRRREIPSRFDLEVVAEKGAVRIVARCRRLLRSLEVRAGGGRVAFWAETKLTPEREEDRLVYERTVLDLPAKAEVVRVIAEDEAGGREVRTLPLGGRP